MGFSFLFKGPQFESNALNMVAMYLTIGFDARCVAYENSNNFDVFERSAEVHGALTNKLECLENKEC